MMVLRWMLAWSAVLVFAGCQPTGPREQPPSADLTASLVLYRRDVPRRLLAIKVTNAGSAPVVVERIQLVWDGFEKVPASEKNSEIEPGERVDLRVPYGAARCDAAPTQPPTAVATVRAGDVTAAEVRIAMDREPADRVRDRECDQRRLAEAVGITLSDDWEHVTLEGGRPALRTSIVLQRRNSDAAIAVVDVASNVLFTVRPAGGAATLPLRIAATESGGALPLLVTASRCDGHAVAESSLFHAFRLWVRVGDDAPQVTTAKATLTGARALDDLILDSCFG